MIRHSSFVIRHSRAALLVLAAASLSACYERKDAVILNPDGSGKISVQVQIAVAPAGEGRKPDILGTGRLFAANLINATRGVDAWADVVVAEAPDGRAGISGTAFFPDINKLKLDLPLEFTWRRDIDGATLAIQRSHSPLRSPGTGPATRPAPAQIRDLVKQAQDQYKQNQPNLQVQLGAYKHDFAFQLPGALERERLMAKDSNTATFSLDGKKVAKAMDEIMANDAALSATFAAGADGPANDDILLQSIFGQKGPVSIHVKYPDGTLPVFDYRSEMRAAQAAEGDMLRAAGIRLAASFAVRETPADVPRQRADTNSALAHQQLVAKARQGKIDLYFAGDTITRRWGATDQPELLKNWSQNFHGWNAANFGWEGDYTENILWRLDNGELDNVNPKVIVLQAGANNVGTIPPDDAKVAEITSGVRAIVALARKKAPNAVIILTAIFPRNDSPAVMPGIQRINANLEKLADGKTIRFLNLNDKLADRDGKLLEGMAEPDKLHLTLKGYQLWADALKPALTELLGPPAREDRAPPPTGDPSATRPRP